MMENNLVERTYGENAGYQEWQVEAEEARRAAIAKKAPFFAKWMWILFLMIIPDSLHAIITLDSFVEKFPRMLLIGYAFGLVCTVVNGLILIKMSEKEYQYKIAGVFFIIGNVINTAIELFEISEAWSLFMLIPAFVLGMIATYHEFMGHASAMREIDDTISAKWRKL